LGLGTPHVSLAVSFERRESRKRNLQG